MMPRPRSGAAIAWIATFSCVLALLVALPATVSTTPSARAASAAEFNAGNIIDDAVFYDSQALDANAIQNFLNQQVRTCRSGYTCLKDYRQNTDNRPADKYCNGYGGAANESAATIIDKVARSCGISQKVLLVLIQKEQSLVTDTAPSDWSYRAATGQGCPDTAACDSSTAGFFYQVYYAARQYEIYRLNPTWWGYQAGRWNNILYNPDRNCGTKSVYIENQATAGLYIYTPYTPNAAALNNLYGTGDGCSSYGNRNFWRIFTDWFGSTRVPGNPNGPFGSVDSVQAQPGSFTVSGWAADPDSSESIAVHVYVSGRGYAFSADLERADVGAALPHLGSRHGFSVTVPVTTTGANDVCVYGINVGAGGNSMLKCVRVDALSGSPFGSLENVAVVQGGVTAAGWAIDPDTADPIDVHIYVGSVGTAVRADHDRADVAAVHSRYGPSHGFGRTITASPGVHQVCAYGINVGLGGNTALGCREVTVPGQADQGRRPIGMYEGITATGTSVTVSGWAIDPDTAAPISVRVDARGTSNMVIADRSRSDVGAAYPAYGSSHGFASTLTLPAGTTEVCVTAVNSGQGGDTPLGCKSVTVKLPDLRRPPVGVLESVTVSGANVTASGWALDPDTEQAIAVHLYVGSRGTAHIANKPRPDVGSVYPMLGADHGFGETLALPVGRSTVCAYAINNGDGGNTLLGCRDIVRAANERPPFGNLEGVSVSGGTISVDGWAIDPDTADPVAVHVYVGAVGTAHVAELPRGDVAAAYAAFGERHGFSIKRPSSPGTYQVCVYAINDGAGPHTLLGCRGVSVP